MRSSERMRSPAFRRCSVLGLCRCLSVTKDGKGNDLMSSCAARKGGQAVEHECWTFSRLPSNAERNTRRKVGRSSTAISLPPACWDVTFCITRPNLEGDLVEQQAGGLPLALLQGGSSAQLRLLIVPRRKPEQPQLQQKQQQQRAFSRWVSSYLANEQGVKTKLRAGWPGVSVCWAGGWGLTQPGPRSMAVTSADIAWMERSSALSGTTTHTSCKRRQGGQHAHPEDGSMEHRDSSWWVSFIQGWQLADVHARGAPSWAVASRKRPADAGVPMQLTFM